MQRMGFSPDGTEAKLQQKGSMSGKDYERLLSTSIALRDGVDVLLYQHGACSEQELTFDEDLQAIMLSGVQAPACIFFRCGSGLGEVIEVEYRMSDLESVVPGAEGGATAQLSSTVPFELQDRALALVFCDIEIDPVFNTRKEMLDACYFISELHKQLQRARDTSAENPQAPSSTAEEEEEDTLEDLEQAVTKAAITIQSSVRQHQSRRQVQILRSEADKRRARDQDAATRIQAQFRRFLAVVRVKELLEARREEQRAERLRQQEEFLQKQEQRRKSLIEVATKQKEQQMIREEAARKEAERKQAEEERLQRAEQLRLDAQQRAERVAREQAAREEEARGKKAAEERAIAEAEAQAQAERAAAAKAEKEAAELAEREAAERVEREAAQTRNAQNGSETPQTIPQWGGSVKAGTASFPTSGSMDWLEPDDPLRQVFRQGQQALAMQSHDYSSTQSLMDDKRIHSGEFEVPPTLAPVTEESSVYENSFVGHPRDKPEGSAARPPSVDNGPGLFTPKAVAEKKLVPEPQHRLDLQERQKQREGVKASSSAPPSHLGVPSPVHLGDRAAYLASPPPASVEAAVKGTKAGALPSNLRNEVVSPSEASEGSPRDRRRTTWAGGEIALTPTPMAEEVQELSLSGHSRPPRSPTRPARITQKYMLPEELRPPSETVTPARSPVPSMPRSAKATPAREQVTPTPEQEAEQQRVLLTNFKVAMNKNSGIRVIKHNMKNGLTGTKILRYDPAQQMLYWDTKKFLGRQDANLAILNIKSVARRGLLIEVEVQGGKGRGAIGFETTRPVDADMLYAGLLALQKTVGGHRNSI